MKDMEPMSMKLGLQSHLDRLGDSFSQQTGCRVVPWGKVRIWRS